MALVINGPRGGEVAACCSTAVAQGVRPGMPLVEAQSLVRELGVATYDPAADRRALVKCAEACERFCPRVALEDGAEPESMLLDISNLEHLWGSEEKLVGRVEKFFTRRGYLVRVAAAETVGAAWAKAHFEGGGRKGEGRREDCELQISDIPVPSPQPLVSTQLPVQSLRIAEDTALVLRELGIETVGQLVALPREELASRFGDELLRRLDQLTGTGREVIEPERTGGAGGELCAGGANGRSRGAHLCAEATCESIGSAVGCARSRGGAVGVFAAMHNDQIVPLRVGLLQPSASARQLLELIELHLEMVKLTDEVERVELRAAVVGRLGERQGELFADRWPTDPHQLAVLVNRLSSRLGDERVLRAELRASPVPERAMKWRGARDWELGARGALSASKRKDRETRRQGDKEKSRRSPAPCLPLSLSPCLPPRPLLLYPKPQAMEVVCVAPDGPPQFVWLENRREPIVECMRTGADRNVVVARTLGAARLLPRGHRVG